MLPVASPQHVAADYRRDEFQGPPYVDPMESALGMGTYLDVAQDAYQSIPVDNQGGVTSYQAPPPSASQPPDGGLERFKHQKIQEFRQALDIEIERKRQQAQKNLEDAERERWQQLRDFQDALQGELAQTNMPPPATTHAQTQQHVNHMSSPMYQQDMTNTPRSVPQHVMVTGPNSVQYYATGDAPSAVLSAHAMPSPSAGSFPSQTTATSTNGYMQQQQRGVLRTASPLHTYHSRTGTLIRPQQTPPVSVYGHGRMGSTDQSIPRAGSPIRHPQHEMGAQSMSVHQQVMAAPGSPLRQHLGPSNYMHHQPNMARPDSPARQMLSMGTSGYSIHQQGMTRAASPFRQQNLGSVMAREDSPIRQHMMDPNSKYSNDATTIQYDDTERRHHSMERSSAPLQSHRPQASPYHEAPHSPNRASSPQRSPMERPPTVREMQEHFQQYKPRDREGIWRMQDRAETFTFDNVDDGLYNQRPGLSAAQSAGYDRTAAYTNRLTERSSTWNPASDVGSSPYSTGNNPSAPKVWEQERMNEAEQLEKEYHKLTAKNLSPAKKTALMNVKKLQEIRRQKLEALTARVVENRRRLAREVKTVDRPREISFVDKLANEIKVDDPPREIFFDDSREEREPVRSHQNEARDSQPTRNQTSDSPSTRKHKSKRRDSHSATKQKSGSRKKHLDVLEEMDEPSETEDIEEPTETEEGFELREGEDSSSSEHFGDVERDSSLSRGELESSYGKESTSEDKESSSEEALDSEIANEKSKSEAIRKETKDLLEQIRKEKSRSKSRGRKGERKAKDFVEKLREKRTKAAAVPHTYNRDDVLAALETGKTKITLPTRDPKLARKNRRLSSARLVDEKKTDRPTSRGRSTKIATKKSTKVESRSTAKETGTKSLESPLPKILLSNMFDDDKKKPLRRKTSQRIHSKKDGPDGDTRTRKSRLAPSGISIVSDLSESAYGVASHTGSGRYNNHEDREDTRNSESTTSVFKDIDIFSDSEGKTTKTGDDDTFGDIRKAREKKKKLKVRELQSNSMSEGFEVDLNSLYSKYLEKNATAEEDYEATVQGLVALQELEKRLDEEDRRSVMPELLELTELHGWNLNKVVQHFVHLFPQIMPDLEGLTLQQLLQRPAKALENDQAENPQHPDLLSQSPASPMQRYTLVKNSDDDLLSSPASSLESGWRSRIQATRRTHVDNDSSIDMSDVRTSLRSISRRQRRGARRGAAFKSGLQSLDEH